MVNAVRGSTRPERLRFLQLVTSNSNIRYTLGNEPNKTGINEEKIGPNEFIVGCYGYLSKRFTEETSVVNEESQTKEKKVYVADNILMGFGFIVGRVDF